jgi:hypothetical protein
MEGRFLGRYTIVNPYEEPLYVLFKCPHPAADPNSRHPLNASGLSLVSSAPGIEENTATAWFWSGEIEPGQSVEIAVSYRVASITGVRYQITSHRGHPIKAHRVEMEIEDLPSMIFESGEGAAAPVGNSVVWERNNFLPPDHFAARIGQTRNLYTALQQLVEIGPLVSLLFMISAVAVMFTRRKLTSLQVLTISAGYGFYFPLILYLSARFSFPVALMIAALAPGLLLLNYARWLLGFRAGVLGGAVFLALYQVFPTLAAFAGWNRGLVLLCLGGVTLFVLIQLQNRALKQAMPLLALWLWLAIPCGVAGQEVQVIVPGTLVRTDAPDREEDLPALISYGVAEYGLQIEDRFVQVTASVPLEVFRKGAAGLTLFTTPVYLLSWELPPFVRLITSSNAFHLEAVEAGQGMLKVSYRAPIQVSESQSAAVIPVLNVPSGHLILSTALSHLEFKRAALWNKRADGEITRYELGVAGGEAVIVTWAGKTGDPASGPALATELRDQLYGIGITESRQLTVINSDGSCTHFAEFQLPPFHPPLFEVTLPAGSQVVSVSVNGVEREKPVSRGDRILISFEGATPRQEARRVSLQLSLAKVRLGFIGVMDLELPQAAATVGTLEWVIVLPSGFRPQMISSGLEVQRQAMDLSSFGDYGRVLKSHPQISLLKTLLPPIPVHGRIKYFQHVPGVTTELGEFFGSAER